MPAEGLPLLVSGAHMQMGIELAVLGGDGARQGHDLIGTLKAVGMVLLLLHIENAHGKVARSAQGADGGQLDILPECDVL